MAREKQNIDIKTKGVRQDALTTIGIERIARKDGFYVTVNLVSTSAQTAANYGQFFTATCPCEVMIASEVHSVAGTDGGTVTLDVEKLTGITALGSGVSVLAATFNLKSTAYTPVQKSGTTLSSNRQLATTDRLALKTSGTLTALEGVQVTLYIKPLGKGDYR
jgi:hypothetical protein